MAWYLLIFKQYRSVTVPCRCTFKSASELSVQEVAMKKIQKILACVDLSDYSKMTMDHAVAMARGFMTEIVVLNVINVRDINAVSTASNYYPEIIDIDKYIKNARDDRYKQVYDFLKSNYSDDMTRMSIVIEVGVPFEAILKAIDTENADLVIVGNKGKGNIIGTLFGTNAEKVFRHSPVPVLSVRDPTQHKRHLG